MPRLPPHLLWQAHWQSPLLPLLLRPCRDLRSAQNELRWLREHAVRTTQSAREGSSISEPWRQHLHRMCHERSKGKPLQYILGSQPFGDLDILCRPGVLIPRLETESITTHLASTLVPSVTEPNAHRSLCILDLCTGTGCIPLLLHALLSPNFSKLEIVGVDISQTAINLAENNKAHNIANRHLEELASKQVKFYKHNIFSKEFRESAWLSKENWDVVVSNPPYISQREFDNTTSRSVRKYEPKRALVPSRAVVSNDDLDGDAFYPYIIRLVTQTGAKSLLMEVADMTQATRVAQMVSKSGFWKHWEIWRDWPGQGKPAGKFMDTGGTSFIIRGEGNGRAVVAWS